MKRLALALLTAFPASLPASDRLPVSLLPGCIPEHVFKKTYTAVIEGHPESTFAGLRLEVCGQSIAEEDQITSARAFLTPKGKDSYSSTEAISNTISPDPALLDAYEYTLELILSEKAANNLRAYASSGTPAIILVAVRGKVVGKFAFAGPFSGRRLVASGFSESNANVINDLTSRSRPTLSVRPQLHR